MVGTDYFTKWVEAEPLANIKDVDAKRFVWKNIDKNAKYLNQSRHLQLGFDSYSLQQVPRSRNTHADFLATLATSSVQSLPRVILVEDLCKPTKLRAKKF